MFWMSEMLELFFDFPANCHKWIDMFKGPVTLLGSSLAAPKAHGFQLWIALGAFYRPTILESSDVRVVFVNVQETIPAEVP